MGRKRKEHSAEETDIDNVLTGTETNGAPVFPEIQPGNGVTVYTDDKLIQIAFNGICVDIDIDLNIVYVINRSNRVFPVKVSKVVLYDQG